MSQSDVEAKTSMREILLNPITLLIVTWIVMAVLLVVEIWR